MEIRENVSLAPYTTLGVGGKARYFIVAGSVEDLKEAVSFADEKNVPLLVLGGGSNVLIHDEGFSGLVVRVQLQGVSFEDVDADTVNVKAYAGEDWDELVSQCVSRGLYGIENMSGIPGTVGGAPIQNIGAYGAELQDVLVSVEVFDTNTHEVRKLTPEECKFSYRDSIFKHDEGKNLTVLQVTLQLKRNGKLNTTYKGVRGYFDEHNVREPTISDMRTAILNVRAEKGMVIHSDYKSYKSAGSFFKNPIVDRKTCEKILKRKPDMPMYEVDENNMKIPAAFLIENSGFKKGGVYSCKNVGISPKHTLALINLGNASAEEFSTCAKEIQKQVFKEFGIQLEPEVRFIGKFT